MSKVRRGVRMTASGKRAPAAWREELLDEASKLQEAETEASRIHWEAVEREAQVEVRKLRLGADIAEGKRGTAAPEYDDVAGAEVDEVAEAERIKAEADARPAAPPSPVPASAPSSPASSRAMVTAGQGDRDKKRGGQKRTGASRRKRDDGEDEDGGTKKRKKKGDDDKDDDRWVKLTLKGEEKTKRIDATRIVHYHDFDTENEDVLARAKAAEVAQIAVAREKVMSGSNASSSTLPTATGALRATLRNLWADDSEDE